VRYCSQKLERYALALGDLLVRLLQDKDARVGPLACVSAERLGFPAAAVVERIRRNQQSDLSVIGGLLSPACYIDQSLPAVLYLAARYPDNFEAALIANANAGGNGNSDHGPFPVSPDGGTVRLDLRRPVHDQPGMIHGCRECRRE
jgi:hypothetical protein